MNSVSELVYIIIITVGFVIIYDMLNTLKKIPKFLKISNLTNIKHIKQLPLLTKKFKLYLASIYDQRYLIYDEDGILLKDENNNMKTPLIIDCVPVIAYECIVVYKVTWACYN